MIGNNGINGAIKQGIEKVRDLGDAVAADAAAVFGEAASAAATAVATASDAVETVAATVAAAAGEGDAENQRIAVLVDSATDVPPEVVEKYGVFIAPLHVNYSDGDFLDRVTIQPEEVYRRFETEIPKTSTPAPADIMSLFDRIAAEGYTHVIAVTISSGLSGTYDLVRSIASGRADLQCAVIDTKSIGIAAGLTAVLVCELVGSGMPFSQVIARAEGTAERSEGFFCVNTLEYLYKGGRIGAATYAIGSKPRPQGLAEEDRFACEEGCRRRSRRGPLGSFRRGSRRRRGRSARHCRRFEGRIPSGNRRDFLPNLARARGAYRSWAGGGWSFRFIARGAVEFGSTHLPA